jgi:hypothetical protein
MAISMFGKDEHGIKWDTINRRLKLIGYWVMWENDYRTMEYRYAIGKIGETKPMGIYEDEDTAKAMVKMLWTNAVTEGE